MELQNESDGVVMTTNRSGCTKYNTGGIPQEYQTIECLLFLHTIVRAWWFSRPLSNFPSPSAPPGPHQFVEVDTQRVIAAIQQQAHEWVQRYGAVLRELAEDQLRCVLRSKWEVLIF